MKVGIISKEDHAKNHAAALERAGFVPVMLGSSPSEIPPTIPLVVCRTQSCSHGGMDTALAWSRAGKGRLIVANGVTTIMTKAFRFRDESKPEAVEDTTPENELERAVPLSYEDLQEAAQVLAEARPDDTYEVFVSVLHRMYPNEEVSLLRSVAATVRPPPAPEPVEVPVVVPVVVPVEEATPTPTTAPEALPMTVEPAPVAPAPSVSQKVYPKRFAAHLSEAEVNTRMEQAWEVRSSMTDKQAAAVGKWASRGAVGDIPNKGHLIKFDRKPLAFAGLLLLCAETALVQRDITRAYLAVTGKKHFAIMADIAAWSLDMKLEAAKNAIPKNAIPKNAETAPVVSFPNTPEEYPVSVQPAAAPVLAAPVPAPVVSSVTEDSTPALLKALSASLDALLVKVGEIDGRVGDLTARIESMAHAPSANAYAASSMEDTLVGLANKGLEVVVRPSR